LTEFDLRGLLEALHEHDVRFVVIGGVAVGAHGYLRGTEDLDVVPDPEPANLRALGAALEALDSTLPTVKGRRFDPEKDGTVILRGGNVSAETRFGGIDVVQRLDGVPEYADLSADAVDSDLLGVPVRVCSLGRLREMKQGLGRTQDRLDLENLPEE
jgi:hypothetical protein